MKDDSASLLDMSAACQSITQFLDSIRKPEFETNFLVQSAVIRQLEVLGEAAKRVSLEFRKTHSSIPWKNIAGMRDRLIHDYDDVDLDLVWDVATQEVPRLDIALKLLLPKPPP